MKFRHKGYTFFIEKQEGEINPEEQFDEKFFIVTTKHKDLEFLKEGFEVEKIENHVTGEQIIEDFKKYHFIELYGYRSSSEIWLNVTKQHQFIGYVVIEKSNISFDNEFFLAKQYIDYLEAYYQYSLFKICVIKKKELIDCKFNVTVRTIYNDTDSLELEEKVINYFKNKIKTHFLNQ